MANRGRRPTKATKTKQPPASVPENSPASREEFNDGYSEWHAFHEDDDDEEGTAEVRSAFVDGSELVANLDYESWSYIVRMEKRGEQWVGTYKRFEGGRLDVGGRCRGKELRADGTARTFEGRWLEDDTSYKWVLLLRSPTRPSRTPPSAPEARRGVPLDRFARVKLVRLGAFIAKIANAHEVGPATLNALLTAHDSLNLPAK